MELKLNDQLFVVGGASGGLGKAIAEALLNAGALVIAVARTAEKLMLLKSSYGERAETVEADLTQVSGIQKLIQKINGRQVHGLLVNAGGPPAMTVVETKLSDWDEAYRTVLRWKVDLVLQVLPLMQKNKYGRILFIESAAVKQPIPNLVLSNAFRLGVIGFMKTLSMEISREGITLNALAPGFHDTNALNRLIDKKTEQSGMNRQEAVNDFIRNIPVGSLGAAADFASLALWMLSPGSRYITGQTISVDGGIIKGIMG